MKRLTKKLTILVLIVFLTALVTAQTSQQDILKEGLTLKDNSTPNPSGTGNQIPENGTFHLELNFTEKEDTEKGDVEILDFSLRESKKMRVGTTRATGSAGNSHSILLLDEKENVIQNETFRLYSEAISDVMGSDGNLESAKYDKNYYNRHLFNLKANYSARKIVVRNEKDQIFELDIKSNVCTGENPAHYCEFNNFTKEKGGEEIGIYDGSGEVERVSLWDKIVSTLSKWIDIII